MAGILSVASLAQDTETDLMISVSSDSLTIPVNTNFYYVVYLENLGDNAATFITLKDSLPAEITFVSSPDACTVVNAIVNCVIDDLPPGKSTSITYAVRAIAAGTNVSNQVVVSAAESDSNPNNNTASISVDIVTPAPADIALTGSLSRPRINISESVEITFEISSIDDITAYRNKIELVLPDQIEYVSSSSCTKIGTLIRCETGTVTTSEPGQASLQVRAISPGTINLAAIASHIESDPEEENNSINLVLTINNPPPDSADIRLDMTPSDTQFIIGEPVILTFTVVNSGPSDATGVSVIHELPAELEFISSPDCSNVNPEFVICDIGNLPIGQTIIGQLSVSAVTVSEAITSSANIGGNEFDPNLFNNARAITLPGIDPLAATPTPIIITATPTYTPSPTVTPFVITATPSLVEPIETSPATTNDSDPEADTENEQSEQNDSHNDDEGTSTGGEGAGGEETVENMAPSEVYGWTRYESADLIQVTGSWFLRSMNNASKRGYHESRDSGATLRYPFEGDGFRIGYRSEVNGARFQILLDGDFVDYYVTDFEDIESATEMRQSFVTQPYWVTSGYHVVDIQCLADGDGAHGCNIDFIEIFRGPPMPERTDSSDQATDEVIVEDIELITAPPTIAPPPTPEPNSIITVDVLVSVDVNNNNRVDANEGVEDITVRAVDVLNNTLLASAVTDSSGAVRIRVVAQNDVVLLIPVLGETFYVRRRGTQISETWNLALTPANIPGLIP
jgi:uncharacterized repeat protein (TIGR01451 family)